MPLGARNDFQSGRISHPCRGHDGPGTYRIDRDGLFHEHMLPGPDGGIEMDRPEKGRCGEDHDIYVCFQQVVVSLEADKASFIRYLSPVSFLQLPAAPVKPILKYIGQGGYFQIGSGVQVIDGRAGSAAPATDQTGLQYLATGGPVQKDWGRTLRPGITAGFEQ